MRFLLGNWQLRTDPAENARGKVPLLCTCQGCRNFLAAVETLPGETRNFFHRLGLDIRCPTEVLLWEPPGPDGYCDYQVWYDFPGELLRIPADKPPYPAAPGLRVAFCSGEERRMAPLVGQVHMDAFFHLPFVLDEPWEDGKRGE